MRGFNLLIPHAQFCAMVVISLQSMTYAAQTGVGLPTSSPSSAPLSATNNKIKAPCLDVTATTGPRIDLQACSTVLRHRANGTADGLLDRFESFYKYRINCFYQGTAVTGMTADPSGACRGVPLAVSGLPAPTVCNLEDGEDQTNYRGQSCGSYQGLYEQSHLRGIRVQAWKYFRNQIVTEVETTHALSLSPSCIAMAQDYQDKNVTANGLSDQILAGANITALPSQVYSGAIDFCSQDSSQVSQVLAQTQNGSNSRQYDGLLQVPKGASCMLAASRGNRVSLFEFVMHCEMDYRFDRFYATTMSSFANSLRDAINNQCGGSSSQGSFDNCYSPVAKRFFQDVMRNNIPGRFTTKNDGLDFVKPENQVCMNTKFGPGSIFQDIQPENQEFYSLGFFPSVLMVGARRRRSNFLKSQLKYKNKFKRLIQKYKNSFVFIGRFLQLSAFFMFSFAGGCPHTIDTCTGSYSSGNSRSPIKVAADFCCEADPQTNIKRIFASPTSMSDYQQCVVCQQSYIPSGNTSNCITPRPSAGPSGGPSPTPGPITISAQTDQLHSQISSFLSPLTAGADPDSSPTPSNFVVANGHTSAATSGRETASGNSNGNTGPAATLPTGGGPGGRSSNGGGTGSGLSGTSFGASGSTNLIQSSDAQKPVPLAVDASKGATQAKVQSTGGGYGTSNSSGGLRSTGTTSRDSGSSRPILVDPGSGDASTSQDFGSTGVTDSNGEVNTIILSDPEDYFTRINLDQNLFKTIHDRYQGKATEWTTSK